METTEERLSQHALYNHSNKYGSIKTELAASYIRDLLAKSAGGETVNSGDLNNTLSELFSTFFPGKTFLGPEPTPEGQILFNVKTDTGAIHDINDLSSGEKEVLYGYLRLRNAAPRNSVLLIDEPELHLNPRLLQGLPQFYHKFLGQALGSQLWLVTHSDTLLRQIVGQAEFKVFHMQPPGEAQLNQAKEVRASKEVERLVIDLVGDLAAYRPGAKIVILEGGGDSDFDVRLLGALFSDFQARVNLISGGNKQRVRELHSLLENVRSSGSIAGQFYSIADRDFAEELESQSGRVLTWDRFHIENYLLEPEYIHFALRDLSTSGAKLSSAEVIDLALRDSARQTLPSLVRHHVETYANRVLMDCIRTKTDPRYEDVAEPLRDAIERSFGRLKDALSEKLLLEKLKELETLHREKLLQDLESGEWRKTFRGRDILKRFVGSLPGGIGYEVLRDLIIARMRDAGFQPIGMKTIVEKILSDPISL
jgi:hypothetical protein